jgi:hypothetical protein
LAQAVAENATEPFYVVTTCSVWHGGSGQPLLSTKLSDGKFVKGINGQPQLHAFGMFVSVDSDHQEEVIVPNVDQPSAVVTF